MYVCIYKKEKRRRRIFLYESMKEPRACASVILITHAINHPHIRSIPEAVLHPYMSLSFSLPPCPTSHFPLSHCLPLSAFSPMLFHPFCSLLLFIIRVFTCVEVKVVVVLLVVRNLTCTFFSYQGSYMFIFVLVRWRSIKIIIKFMAAKMWYLDIFLN